MSGIEVAGIALAILPMVVSATTQYDKCLAALKRFRRFKAEANKTLLLLGVQKRIFTAQCRILLSTVVGRHTSLEMLGLFDDLRRTDSTLEGQLVLRMGDNYRPCVDIMRLIDQNLRSVDNECQKLADTSAVVDPVRFLYIASKSLF